MAGEILARANVDVAWLECPAGMFSWSGSGCNAPPKPRELVVRLVRTTSGASRHVPHALGYALIDAATGSGTLATVFADRVERLAAKGRLDQGLVLGRAMAHEIGHLILGTNDHSASGLMREHWTFEELKRDRPEDWAFTPLERDRLQAGRFAGGAARGRTGGAGTAAQSPHTLLDKNP